MLSRNILKHGHLLSGARFPAVSRKHGIEVDHIIGFVRAVHQQKIPPPDFDTARDLRSAFPDAPGLNRPPQTIFQQRKNGRAALDCGNQTTRMRHQVGICAEPGSRVQDSRGTQAF